MKQKRLQSKKGYDRMEMQVGDLVYRQTTDTYGMIIELSMTGADSTIQWFDGDLSYNFYDNVLLWKKLADKKLVERV